MPTDCPDAPLDPEQRTQRGHVSGWAWVASGIFLDGGAAAALVLSALPLRWTYAAFGPFAMVLAWHHLFVLPGLIWRDARSIASERWRLATVVLLGLGVSVLAISLAAAFGFVVGTAGVVMVASAMRSLALSPGNNTSHSALLDAWILFFLVAPFAAAVFCGGAFAARLGLAVARGLGVVSPLWKGRRAILGGGGAGLVLLVSSLTPFHPLVWAGLAGLPHLLLTLPDVRKRFGDWALSPKSGCVRALAGGGARVLIAAALHWMQR